MHLVMIVKNEVHGIKRTLDTVRPYLTGWTVLDTGSTDGTQDLVIGRLAMVPGALYHEPFVDFATSRNRALALARKHAEGWLILLDSDDLVCGPMPVLVPAKAYYVRMRGDGITWQSTRLLHATAQGWQYHCSVHEVLIGPGAPSGPVPGLEIWHKSPPRSAEQTKARWSRDLDLLAQAPVTGRSLFYYAQTLECLGRLDEAAKAYYVRIAHGGWAEEIYESKWRLARIARAQGKPWTEIRALLLFAHAQSPWRPEPLRALASGEEGPWLAMAQALGPHNDILFCSA